ncbi:DUF397 domain-containing protein [Actinoplanes cyaneus]|uniref:DUF397 domain-containing protein n=1 Tax=Actinoplanes cyaneus TaxID=52696 RepID=UPI0019445B3A|nr:DUF397 domain-containing protein [Actinoplanes cyaneus]MCW2135889.1 protein of unknown function (DUF397) [Actinoplanes cyaneus]
METHSSEWSRSSFCGNSACVEIALCGEDVLVRDSKNPGQPHLSFSRGDWNNFLDQVATGQCF